jgi:hypothetical protein
MTLINIYISFVKRLLCNYSYLEEDGEIMATQSLLEVIKTPLTVTVRYSSFDMVEFGLTLIFR